MGFMSTPKSTKNPNRTYEERLDQLESFCRTNGRRPSQNAPTREERGLNQWMTTRIHRKDVTERLAQLLDQYPPTPRGNKLFSHRNAIREEFRLDDLEQFCRNRGRLPSSSRDYPIEARLHGWVYNRIRDGKIPPRLQALIEQYPDTVPGRVKRTGRA
jgi:hypothetical protein